VLASSAVDREFIGGVIVTVLASSAVDRGFIGGVIATVLASSAVDRGFEPRSGVRYYNEHNVSMDKILFIH
jgi:hypothetical protein